MLLTRAPASTLWLWDPSADTTSHCHDISACDADINAAESSLDYGWVSDHWTDSFARFEPGTDRWDGAVP